MQLHRLFQMFSDSDRSGGEEEGRGTNRRLSLRGTRGAVSGEAGRLIGNERRQLAGSAKVNN